MTEFYARLARDYGAQAADNLIAGFERPVTLRINPLKSDREGILCLLSRGEIERVAWYDDALILRSYRQSEIEESEPYRRGEIYLQSLSSMLPPLVLHPQAGENILDMAAAPGGKTCELYALSGGKALITACERDKFRFERLTFNLARQGATRVNAIRTDATLLDDFLSFDKILLDAPCTGSGTVSSLLPVRFSEEFLKKCVARQEKLLKKAYRLLKKGGTIVYSTCSVLMEEDGEQALRFAKATGAALVPISAPDGAPTLPSPAGTVCICPDARYEGFFLAKFQK